MRPAGSEPGRLRAALGRGLEAASRHARSLVDPRLGWRARLAVLLRAGLLAGVAAPLLLGAYALLLVPLTPSVEDVRKARVERPSVLLSADGKELATFKRFNREWIPLAQVPGHLVDALISTEDHRFWQHSGIDYLRTAAALGRTLTGERQGGSTLTQQLARNLFPDEVGRSPTLTRKLKEAITAIKLERLYSKQQILETYLNTVPFLYNAYGIEMAARTYFDKSAKSLDVLESATLVGMLKGTAYYNPVLNPKRAVQRRNIVLGQMRKHGRLSEAQFRTLAARPLKLDFERQLVAAGPAPHFADQVRGWLLSWAEREGYDVYADGLIVHSTLDSRFQSWANQVVQRQLAALQAVADVEWARPSDGLVSTSLSAYARARRGVEPFRHFWRSKPELLDAFVRETPEFQRRTGNGGSAEEALQALKADAAFMAALRERKTRLEAGFIAIDPRTGYIRAWVGSRDFHTDRYDHVLTARRQPGSTFKPFVYAAALAAGMSPRDRFEDRAVSITLPDGRVWTPKDSDGPSGRRISLEEALVHSRNGVTAQVMQEVGAARVATLARRMGVRHSTLEPVPSLALGTSPVSLLEMVSGYATIAAKGEYLTPFMVRRVTDRQGRVLVEYEANRERALGREQAIHLIDMLRGAVERGTGRPIAQFGLRGDVAGKTGTTQDNADGWFILMHPQLVAGAWVGFNDPRVTMRSDYWGQGAHNALPVVGEFYQRAFGARALDREASFPTRRVERVLDRALDEVADWVSDLLGLKRPSR